MFVDRGRKSLPLGYEMNAHPASSVEDLHAALRDYVIPVRNSIAPGEPFALAPHIGSKLAAELSLQGVAEQVGAWLRMRCVRARVTHRVMFDVSLADAQPFAPRR